MSWVNVLCLFNPSIRPNLRYMQILLFTLHYVFTVSVQTKCEKVTVACYLYDICWDKAVIVG